MDLQLQIRDLQLRIMRCDQVVDGVRRLAARVELPLYIDQFGSAYCADNGIEAYVERYDTGDYLTIAAAVYMADSGEVDRLGLYIDNYRRTGESRI